MKHLIATQPKTQLERVILICRDSVWRTLDRIQYEIKEEFYEFDTTPAISARLRDRKELLKYGYIKERRSERNHYTGRICYFYRLTKVI